jgi:hypothetical protein
MPASPLSASSNERTNERSEQGFGSAFAVLVLPVRQAGIQASPLHTLDSGFRRNNEKAAGILVQSFS